MGAVQVHTCLENRGYFNGSGVQGSSDREYTIEAKGKSAQAIDVQSNGHVHDSADLGHWCSAPSAQSIAPFAMEHL